MSCGYDRKGVPEALAGACAGRVSSREKPEATRCRCRSDRAEGNTNHPDMARGGGPGGVARPRACTEPLCARTGGPHGPPRADAALGSRREVQGRNPPMNDRGKSHRPMVPTKSPNKEGFAIFWSQDNPQTGTKGETPETAKGEPKATSEERETTA